MLGVSRLDSNIESEAASEPKHGEYKCGLVTMVDHMRLGWNFAESVSGQRGAVTEMWITQNTKHETSFKPQAVLTGEV